MEIVKFIFSSFWTFLGSVIFIGVIFEGLAQVIKAIRGIKEPEEEEK